MISSATVYILCFLTSAFCAILLLRSYRAARSGLLVWSALCFIMLAINNFLVVADLIFLPNVDLSWWRLMAALIAVCLLLYGFVWEL